MTTSDDDNTGTRRDEVTRILSADEQRAAADILPLIYEELRALAHARMRYERPDMTMQATALVHEAYVRLVGDNDPGWRGRGHFFGAAAHAMRRILVEEARRKGRLKRGGDKDRVPIDAVEIAADGTLHAEPGDDVEALLEAVERLEAHSPRKGQIVNLRTFAGLSNEETAALLDLSVGTIEREWRFIRAWLKDALED